MRCLVSLLALLVCLGTHGCVTDKKLTPPDSVLDPRSQWWTPRSRRWITVISARTGLLPSA